MNDKNVIVAVEPNSIAEELGLESGDIVLEINNKPIKDVFDYRFLINDEYIDLKIKTKQGKTEIIEIEKDFDEDLGIIFENGLMDNAKSCTNKCIFCFIDQMPKGMRDTLYFKDDDSRLSFLQGNYVTMTNMKDSDIDRIIYYRLSPINISVHTVDPELRKKMLKNRFADKILDIIKRLYDANIEMNLQIVLCPDINDKDKLIESIEVLKEFIPKAKSLSVVPVGITAYREGLYNMRPFTKDESKNVIATIEAFQNKIKKEKGTAFVYAADEFYIKAEAEIPDATVYEDFPQIENGVGMVALTLKEAYNYLDSLKADNKISKTVSIGTGEAAYKYIREIGDNITKKFPNIKINVYPIKNEFFGGFITVSGLLTGGDIINQLKDKEIGEYLLLPRNLLRSGERVLLDDLTVEDIEKSLNTKIYITDDTGDSIVKLIVN